MLSFIYSKNTILNLLLWGRTNLICSSIHRQKKVSNLHFKKISFWKETTITSITWSRIIRSNKIAIMIVLSLTMTSPGTNITKTLQKLLKWRIFRLHMKIWAKVGPIHPTKERPWTTYNRSSMILAIEKSSMSPKSTSLSFKILILSKNWRILSRNCSTLQVQKYQNLSTFETHLSNCLEIT